MGLMTDEPSAAAVLCTAAVVTVLSLLLVLLCAKRKKGVNMNAEIAVNRAYAHSDRSSKAFNRDALELDVPTAPRRSSCGVPAPESEVGEFSGSDDDDWGDQDYEMPVSIRDQNGRVPSAGGSSRPLSGWDGGDNTVPSRMKNLFGGNNLYLAAVPQLSPPAELNPSTVTQTTSVYKTAAFHGAIGTVRLPGTQKDRKCRMWELCQLASGSAAATKQAKVAFKAFTSELNSLVHKNIARTIGVMPATKTTGPVVVSEPLSQTLRAWLLKIRGTNPRWGAAMKDILLSATLQIADAMSFCSDRGVVHGNLSSRHIFAKGTRAGHVRAVVGDFGLARHNPHYFQEKLPQDPQGPTPVRWLALEAMKTPSLAQTSAADVWSFGVVVWEICSLGMIPFSAVPGSKLLQYLDSGERLLMPKKVAAEGDMLFIAELQLLCLRERASERPPFSTLRSAIRNALTTEQGTYMGTVAAGDDDDAENPYLRYNAVSNILQNDSGIADNFFDDDVRDLSKELSAFEADRATISSLWKIGEGNFGEVYRAMLVQDGEFPTHVAVKTLKPTREKRSAIGEFFGEAKIMMQLNDVNVLSLKGVICQSPPYVIILEYIEFGDLKAAFDDARKFKFCVTNSEKTLLITQVASGMAHIAKLNIVHRDLAARNCLLSRDNVVKIADLGLAQPTTAGRYTGNPTQVMPLRWTAPEAFADCVFGEASDVWAFGVCAWEIITLGGSPYKGIRNFDLLNKILMGTRLKPIGSYAPHLNVWAMLELCWHASPPRRPKFEALANSLSKMCAKHLATEPIDRDVGECIRDLKLSHTAAAVSNKSKTLGKGARLGKEGTKGAGGTFSVLRDLAPRFEKKETTAVGAALVQGKGESTSPTSKSRRPSGVKSSLVASRQAELLSNNNNVESDI